MTPEENRAIVQEFYDQWNSGAIDFDRLVHEDVMNHQPDRDPEKGLDKFRQAIEGVMGTVPDSRWTTLKPIAEGDFVACHNRWSGTYGGTIFRAIASLIRYTCKCSTEKRSPWGFRIAEHWVVRDDLGMMLQLGAISTSA